MAALTAAVVLVAALCVLNLLLTLGVIRRLREHTELLNRVPSQGMPRPIAAPGEGVGEFEATTVEGDVLSRDLLDERTLVAFFSPDCWACKDQLPRFVEYASSGRDAERAVTVVVDIDGADDLVATLSPAARVVTEPPEGPVATAFGVRGFPAFCRVASDGTVAVSSHDLDAVLAAPSA